MTATQSNHMDTDPCRNEDCEPCRLNNPDRLSELAMSSVMSVRAHVAKNPWTPVPVLVSLGRDDGNDWLWCVRLAVAGNPRTPADILGWLSYCAPYEVRAAVAGNPNTPTVTLAEQSIDLSITVRAAVAGNLRTAVKTLARMSHYESAHQVLFALAGNPNTPVVVLAVLARTDNCVVQDAVRSHPSATVEVLEYIAHHPAVIDMTELP